MLKLRDIMTAEVLTLSPDATLRDAAAALASRHVTGAPVVAGGRIVGVVSATDLLDFVAANPGVPTERPEMPELGTEMEETLEEEVEGGDVPSSAYFTELWADAGADTSARMSTLEGPEWNALDEHTVEEVMTRKLLTLPPTAEASAAADLMRLEGVHRLLVVEEGKLLGVVTTTDISRAVADHQLTARTYVFNRGRDFDDRGFY